jgi:predicted DNA-binding transcriptional regulator YafY
VARNSEVVRQWEILRAVDGARCGISIAKLAADRGVHQRTIRRDIEALQRAGFPLYDDKVNATSLWKLGGKPFRGLDALTLSVTELCALYLSHAMLGTLGGTPLLNDGERAFLKIQRALPASCRKFLDLLPHLLRSKPRGRKRCDERKVREILGRVLEAILRHRRASMRYASASSGRTKDYVVEPQRIAYAEGGLYLVGWVPEYREIRTFAAERIATFALLDETFTPRALLEPFANSLGVHNGPAETIVIEFEPGAAAYVREREWHPSQRCEDRGDGGVVLTMHVCNDQPLRAWVLGFGPAARVVAPVSLMHDIFEAAHATRRLYAKAVGNGPLEMVSMRAS